MIRYQGDIVIDRPVTAVFEYVTTLDNLPRWSDTNWVTAPNGQAGGVGTRYLIDMGRGPLRAELEFETTVWSEREAWSFRTVSDGPMTWDAEFAFESFDPASTHVRITGEVDFKGWRGLLEPLVRVELRRREQAELVKLKEILERTGQTSH